MDKVQKYNSFNSQEKLCSMELVIYICPGILKRNVTKFVFVKEGIDSTFTHFVNVGI
jgi:hypothetical protein